MPPQLVDIKKDWGFCSRGLWYRLGMMLNRMTKHRFLTLEDEEIVRAFQRWQNSPINPNRKPYEKRKEERYRQIAERKQRAERNGEAATLFAATASSKAFYSSTRWLQIRFQAIQKYGRKCFSCGKTPEHGAIIEIDHIRPRVLYPELAFDVSNMQVLCRECNGGKGLHSTKVIRRPRSQG